MTTDLVPFSFESHEIRATQDEHSNPWFIAKDVCAALGIAWSGVTLNPIKDAWKGLMKFITPGGEQEFAVIREQAVYKLAFRSRKPEAERFTDWVADTIAIIRKTGQYAPTAQPDQTLLPSEQQILSEIIHAKARTTPDALYRKAIAEIWSRFKNKFRVSRYADLPRDQLADAILYVNAMELRCAKRLASDEAPKAAPLDLNYPLESARPPEGNNGLDYYAFAQAEGWIDPNWELLMKLKAAGFNVDGPIYSHQAKIHVMTAMYHGLIGKMVDSMKVACTSLPYAPIYLR